MLKEKTRILEYCAVCVFFTFTVLLYGPLSIYLGNADDFWFSISDFLRVVIPFSAVSFLLLMAVLIVLPERVSSFAGKLLAGITLGLYVQGNYININYGRGVLDGSSIQWDKYTTYGVLDTLAWVICIAAPFAASFIVSKVTDRQKKGDADKNVWKYIAAACLFLTVIQVPALVAQSISYKPNENSEISISDKDMFDLSEKDNIVMFILDTLDGEYYEDYLKKNPGFTDKLTGFTDYRNTVASGARTPVAVPSMFTGKPFVREEPYSEYKKKVWSDENSLSLLDKAGYDIGFYSEAILFDPVCAKYITNFSDGGAVVGSWMILLKKIYKLDLFKFLPHYLKRYVWMDTAEFDKAIGAEEGEPYVLQDIKFFDKFSKEGFTVDSRDKAVRIYHLRGAHNPITMGADGTESENATVDTQVEGVFKGVSEMIDGMKDAGVYDNSTIIITADHGDVNKCEWAILLIKPAGAAGECKVSNAPVSLFDMAVYLSDLAGEKLEGQEFGEDLTKLSEDQKRERYFFRYKDEKRNAAIVEFKTDSTASDRDALQVVKKYDEPDKIEPYELGNVLSFGIEASGNVYTTEGFAQNTGMRTALKGPHSELVIPMAEIPKKESLTVTFDYHVPGTTRDYLKMIIHANGEEVYNGLADRSTSHGDLKFKVPVSTFGKDKKLTIEIDFPEISQDEMEKDVFDRTETIKLNSMLIE